MCAVTAVHLKHYLASRVGSAAGTGYPDPVRCRRRRARPQDTLTEEMVGLAAGLRANAAAMEGAVRERGRLLDGAEALLDGNLDATKRSVRESKAVRTRRAPRRFRHTALNVHPNLPQ